MNNILKVTLPDHEIPNYWYNILPELPGTIEKPLHPITGKPLTLHDVTALAPKHLILQESSTQSHIDIPEDVLGLYRLWRPTPLMRARRLEQALNTPAKIYYKYEGTSPAGSHKMNTAIPQAYYNKKEKTGYLVSETGAGQWGSALSFAASQFGLKLHVYMVNVSFHQKLYRKYMMELWGAQVTPSPSNLTETGRRMLALDENISGSISMAKGEAIEEALSCKSTKYVAPSSSNFVCMHQTVIGLEAIKQLRMIQEYPDIVIGCVGGGSNFAGIAFPFMRDKMSGSHDIRFIAAEPAACPSLTKGRYAYDYCDTAKKLPIMKMYTVGHTFSPEGIHAGGLRYHGMSPVVSLLYDKGLIEAVAHNQNQCFEAAVMFARNEGIIPAPESSHAIRTVVDEAIKAREEEKEKTILFCLSGHGHFDLSAYDMYLQNKLTDCPCTDEIINQALSELPQVEALA